MGWLTTLHQHTQSNICIKYSCGNHLQFCTTHRPEYIRIQLLESFTTLHQHTHTQIYIYIYNIYDIAVGTAYSFAPHTDPNIAAGITCSFAPTHKDRNIKLQWRQKAVRGCCFIVDGVWSESSINQSGRTNLAQPSRARWQRQMIHY